MIKPYDTLKRFKQQHPKLTRKLWHVIIVAFAIVYIDACMGALAIMINWRMVSWVGLLLWLGLIFGIFIVNKTKGRVLKW